MDIVITSIATWFLFVPIAIANGILREKTYKLYVGDLLAHQISTIIASLAFIALSYIMLRDKVSGMGMSQLLAIGLVWVVMTVLFEFGFGHYVGKATWEKLFADYNIFKGRVWGLFLLVVLLSPLIVKMFLDSA